MGERKLINHFVVKFLLSLCLRFCRAALFDVHSIAKHLCTAYLSATVIIGQAGAGRDFKATGFDETAAEIYN